MESYLNRIRLFFRWFYNCRDKEVDRKNINQSEYETPEFVRIKPKKTSRPSPYLETEIWERDEILFIIKYEQYIRNKAALTLFWDLDARNHEVTLLKIKHVRLKERYGEGEIPSSHIPKIDFKCRLKYCPGLTSQVSDSLYKLIAVHLWHSYVR